MDEERPDQGTPGADAERRMIEEMRRAGRLSEDEAKALLAAIGGADGEAGAEPAAQPGAESRTWARGPWIGWGPEARDAAREASREVREAAREASREVRRAFHEARHQAREAAGTGDDPGDLGSEIAGAIREGLDAGLRGLNEGLRGLRSAFGPTSMGPASRQEKTVLEHAVDRGCRIFINSASGDVSVTAGSPGTVRVTWTKQAHGSATDEVERRLAAAGVSVEGDRTTLTVRTDLGPESARGTGPVTIDLHVEVPAEAAVEVRGANGDVEMTGLSGRVRADARNGDVTLTTEAVEQVELHSQNGDVTARFQPTRGGRYELRATAGDVELILPEEASIAIEASTGSGEIESAMEMTVTERRTERLLLGRLGAGEATVIARAGAGDVTIRRP
ncbi:MAG TPA: DUF4097 family beta strand repeat-containing protein [Bacillota bacterium]